MAYNTVQVEAAVLSVEATSPIRVVDLETAVVSIDGAPLARLISFEVAVLASVEQYVPPANDLWVWNGSTEVPANVTVWNGTAEVAASVEVV